MRVHKFPRWQALLKHRDTFWIRMMFFLQAWLIYDSWSLAIDTSTNTYSRLQLKQRKSSFAKLLIDLRTGSQSQRFCVVPGFSGLPLRSHESCMQKRQKHNTNDTCEQIQDSLLTSFPTSESGQVASDFPVARAWRTPKSCSADFAWICDGMAWFPSHWLTWTSLISKTCETWTADMLWHSDHTSWVKQKLLNQLLIWKSRSWDHAANLFSEVRRGGLPKVVLLCDRILNSKDYI